MQSSLASKTHAYIYSAIHPMNISQCLTWQTQKVIVMNKTGVSVHSPRFCCGNKINRKHERILKDFGEGFHFNITQPQEETVLNSLPLMLGHDAWGFSSREKRAGPPGQVAVKIGRTHTQLLNLSAGHNTLGFNYNL